MIAPLVWLVGGGGLLGSHVRSVLPQYFPQARFWRYRLPHFSWSDPVRLAAEFDDAVASFAAAVRAQHSPWVVLWCAGKGTVNSSAAALEPERIAWLRLLEQLGSQLAIAHGDFPGYIFLASSAGGVYGGNPPQVLTERTSPQPASIYGVHKLRMETALREWARSFPNVSYLIGRISTLYGPGQDFDKLQGIISYLSRCLIHRQPANIYVPFDTRRDYFFISDCATQIAASLVRLTGGGRQSIIKILASEQSANLAQIVGVFFRIAKHHSLIISRQTQNVQPRSMNFRSEVWRDLRDLRRTDLAVGIHVLHQYQLTLFEHGLLPPPIPLARSQP